MDLILCWPAAWTAVWATILLIVAVFLYRKATENFDVFSQQGITGPKPVPIFGNLWGIWREIAPKYDVDLVRKYGKTFGFFDGTTANLYTVDDRLIKSVLVKDFDHFVNRRDFKLTSYVARMFVTLLQNQQWKDVRSSISPTFTTGKIKRMSAMIKECADNLADKLEKSISENEGQFEAKPLFSAYTMDVIARCAFGMKIPNLGEEDDDFMKNATGLFSQNDTHKPTIVLPTLFPCMNWLFSYLFIFNKEFKFFLNISENLLKSRENSNEKYHDFVEITSEAVAESFKEDSNGKSVPMWTKEEAREIILAQSILFLFAGFDTTGTTLTNVFYMLAKHPDIQQRLYNEICDKLDQSSDGELTHDLVNSIPYTEQIINETLRLFPPGLRIERQCSKDITYGDMTIKRGMMVTIPTYALHRREEYFPEPEVFSPDRWSPENKSKINPYTFLPFGSGPRNCVGMRFAYEEMKFAICKLVAQYRFFPVAGTPDTMNFRVGYSPLLRAEKFSLGAELRQ